MRDPKDWADVAWGWPFILMIPAAWAGMLFSRLALSDEYYQFCLVGAGVATGYFMVSGVIRYREGRTKLQESFPKWYHAYTLFFGGIVALYAGCFIALAHGVPLLVEPLSHNEQRIFATVNGTVSGGRSCPRVKVPDLNTAFGRSLCVSNEFRLIAKDGDTIALYGRASIFGLYVDSIVLHPR